MDPSRFNMKKCFILIGFAALCFAASLHLNVVISALNMLFSILSPFLIGSAIAFILNVPMRFIERKLFSSSKVQKRIPAALRRGISLFLTFGVVIAIIALLLLVIIPELTDTVAKLGETIQEGINNLIAWGEEKFANNPEILAWFNSLSFDWSSINWEGLLNSAIDFLKNGAENVLHSTISVAGDVFSGITTAFVAFVFAIYMLLQKEKLSLQFRKIFFALLPRKRAEQFITICALSQRVFSNFITGQCVEAVILGFMFFIVMLVLNMPYALLIGCLIAVTALIPIVGAFIGCGVGAFLILMVSPPQALLFVIIFLVLQQIEGNLIYPHVVGNSVGLPSIWVLAAVSIGGSLMGVVGMLTFIPLVSVIYTLFREYVYKKLDEKHIKVK